MRSDTRQRGESDDPEGRGRSVVRRTRTGTARRTDRPVVVVDSDADGHLAEPAEATLVEDAPTVDAVPVVEDVSIVEGVAVVGDATPADDGSPSGDEGATSLAGRFEAEAAPSRAGGRDVLDLRDESDVAARPAAASRAALVVELPRPRRRAPLILGAVLAAAAVVGLGVVLGSRRGDTDGTASTATTLAEVLAAAATPSMAPAVAGSAATTTAAPATAAPTSAAPTSAAPTSAAPTTTAPVATVATTAAPTTTAVVATAPAATSDELPNIYTPVRWAVFQAGRVELQGRVPSQAVADLIATKATAVVGPGNVDVRYIIDPTAPLPSSAPLYVRDTIQFGPGSAVVSPQFKPLLDLGITLMQQNAGVKIWVIGRADNQGDPNANLYLSLDRAQAVIDYIAATGIDPARLVNVPLGTDAALGDNSTAEGRQQNRSVEFVISGLLS